MGLVHLPLLAAFISAYRAGLIPFFLHFSISVSVRELVLKLLALHSPLDPGGLDCRPKDPETGGRSRDKEKLDLDKSDRCEV